jgi:hypothetical protein
MKVDQIKTLADYTSFLLIYLAEADYQVSQQEKEIIMHHISPEKYKHMKQFVDALNDYQRLQVIDYYKDEFLKTPADKAALLGELEDLFHADGRESVLERNLILALKKFIS